jgi:thioester reductase-like protein
MLLEIAVKKTVLSRIIVRVGQLSGAENGAWNAKEWFPALLRSSQLLGHLPTISGVSRSSFSLPYVDRAVEANMLDSHSACSKGGC